MPRGNIVERPGRRSYTSRQSYLHSATQAEPQFCHLMGSNPKPWLTLVMGSGCATSSVQENALLQRANQFIGYTPQNESIPDSIEGQPIGEVVAEFATDLIRDRLRIQRSTALQANPSLGGMVGVQRVPEWIFELFVFTALSSRLYFRIKSLAFAAPRRPDRTDEAVLDDGSRMWGTLLEELITPCRKVFAALEASDCAIVDGEEPTAKSARLKRTLSHVLREISPKLSLSGGTGAVRVSVADLRALTEFAWFCFTEHATPKVYPGWSDLLLYLSNYTLSSPL
jgi:hypothetical protein